MLKKLRKPLKVVAIVSGLALAALGVVVAYNAATLRSRQHHGRAMPSAPIDRDAAVDRLARAVRFRTDSSSLVAGGDAQAARDDYAREMNGLRDFLKASYPGAFSGLEPRDADRFSLLLTWRGGDPGLAPALFTGHMDVVPAALADGWHQEPFAGLDDGQYLWGRGTLDDKLAVLGILEAAEGLLKEGYRPRRTLYFGFGHDEEVKGDGARAIAALLKAELGGAKLDSVIDEGTAVVDGVVAGFQRPVAPIGLVEKGYLDVILSVKKQPGGHSSIPPPSTAIGILARAIERLEARPMAERIDPLTRDTLETLGAELPFKYRLAFGNLWLTSWPVRRALAGKPETNAAIRTTAAATIIRGGAKDNVLPETARAVVNYRILPGDSIEKVLQHVVQVVDDPDRIEVAKDPIQAFEPSRLSTASSDAYARLQESIHALYPDAVVFPFVATAATDARNYEGICEHVYRFLPVRLKAPDLNRIHGVDERIGKAEYEQVIAFYRDLIQRSGGGEPAGGPGGAGR